MKERENKKKMEKKHSWLTIFHHLIIENAVTDIQLESALYHASLTVMDAISRCSINQF